MGLTTKMYIQCITPLVSVPKFSQTCHCSSKSLCRRYPITLSIYFIHASAFSNVTSWYLVSLGSRIVLLQRIRSLTFLMSLFLAKGTITVLLGLMDKSVLPHHCCTMPRAVYKITHRVCGKFSLITIPISSAYPIVQ
jgi:hypothetical protein